MEDTFLQRYLVSADLEQWNIIGNSPVEQFSSELLQNFCDTVVTRFAQDMLVGVKALQALGFRFMSDEPIRMHSEPAELDFPAVPPPMLAAWCRCIEHIDLTQQTSQMLDMESPFRGFGMFGIDLKWHSLTDLTDPDGCFFYQEDRWHLNAFAMAGQMIVRSPLTVDCVLIDGDDETHSLYHCMQRFAQYGGFSRIESASKASLRLAPKPESLPTTFPQHLSF